MSGREPEPVAAFFPSIDRNLIRDLDRHLRNAAPQAEAAGSRPPPSRPSTSDILDAVEQAASSMGVMTGRIQELETRNQELEAVNQELEATNTQLRAKLGELLHNQQNFDGRLRAENERAVRAEQVATHHASRSQVLERDLEAALGDLTRIAEAITGTLGASTFHRE